MTAAFDAFADYRMNGHKAIITAARKTSAQRSPARSPARARR